MGAWFKLLPLRLNTRRPQSRTETNQAPAVWLTSTPNSHKQATSPSASTDIPSPASYLITAPKAKWDSIILYYHFYRGTPVEPGGGQLRLPRRVVVESVSHIIRPVAVGNFIESKAAVVHAAACKTALWVTTKASGSLKCQSWDPSSAESGWQG